MSTQQTSPAPAATVFDEPARQIIRQALRDYMREHRIGVPALKSQIENNGPRGQEIPLSTLQRFLTATHQTSEMYVQIFDAFARPLPYYGRDSDLVHLGQALATFLGATERASARDGHAALRAGLPGQYRRFALGAAQAPYWRKGAPKDNVHSILYIRATPGAPYFEVHEQRDEVILMERRMVEHVHRGVGVLNGPVLHILMRDRLTRLPCSMTLTDYPVGYQEPTDIVLLGEAFDAAAEVSYARLQLVRDNSSEAP